MSATDPTALTASAAVAAIERGELSAGELFDAYRAAAAADDLNAYVWVADDAPAAPAAGAPLAGVPLAVKDLFCTEGVPSQAGSKILEGYRPPYTASVVARLHAAGAPLLGKTNQDEFAMGSSNENSAYGPVLNPWRRDRVPGGSQRRQRRRRRRGLGAVGAGHRYGRLDPPARRAVRDRRPEADVRHRQSLRDDRLRVVAGPGRPADARRRRTPRCCSSTWSAATTATRPRSAFPARSAPRPPSAWTASGSASPRSSRPRRRGWSRACSHRSRRR